MDMLDIYTDYLICQNDHATATGLSDMLNGDISHDKVSRYLRHEVLTSKVLWQYIKSSVREKESPDGVLLLDDTIEDKPYTDENEINFWHYSHAKGRVVKGINILTCMVRYDDFYVPIGYEIINKDILYSDLNTKTQRRKSSVTKNELFLELINQAVNNKVLFEKVRDLEMEEDGDQTVYLRGLDFPVRLLKKSFQKRKWFYRCPLSCF